MDDVRPSEVRRKRNCHNCKFGQYESDGEYGEYTYFICEKREDDGRNNLESNLGNPSYLEKAKACCELSALPVEAKCIECGDDDICWPDDVVNHICFDCYSDNAINGEG